MATALTEFQQSVLWHVMTGKLEVTDEGLKTQSCQATKKGIAVPQTWDVVSLKHIARLVAGGTPKSTNLAYYAMDGNGYDWVQVCDINNSTLTATSRQISKDGKRFTKTLRAPSVALAMKASVGKVAKINHQVEINEATLGIMPIGVERDWVFYALLTQRAQIEELGRGGTQSNTNAQICRNIPIPLPPPEERARILAFIEKFTQSVPDSAPAVKALDAWYQSTLWHVMTGKLRVTDEGLEHGNAWSSVKLKFVIKVAKGQQLNQSCLKPDGLYPLFNGGENLSGYSDFYNAQGPLITISEGGSKAGSVNLIEGRCWISGHCYKVYSPKMDTKFLYFWLKANIQELYNLGQGVGVLNISKDSLDNLSLPLPPPEERARILDFVTRLEAEYQSKRTQLLG